MELHITKHTGKLEGIPSINTSPLENTFCKMMSERGEFICSHCYAQRLSKFRSSMEKKFKDNLVILREYPMAARIPVFNNRYVRLHSFGELVNEAHLANFYDIAEANPDVVFALWTKREDVVRRLHRIKPRNLSLVYSIASLDPVENEIPEGFNHSYAVFSEGQSCGARCLDCLKCWDTKKSYKIRQKLH